MREKTKRRLAAGALLILRAGLSGLLGHERAIELGRDRPPAPSLSWRSALYGREFMGIERTTFVIDKAGVVRRVFPKVKVNGHTEEVIEALKEIA